MTTKKMPPMGKSEARTEGAQSSTPLRIQHTTDHSKSSTYIRAGGRVVGEVIGDVLQKHIEFSKHALRRPPALCLDVDSLAEAERLGARYVEITDNESGKIYRAAISTVWAKGFSVDRGFGKQRGLELKHWRRDGESTAEQMQMFSFSSAASSGGGL